MILLKRGLIGRFVRLLRIVVRRIAAFAAGRSSLLLLTMAPVGIMLVWQVPPVPDEIGGKVETVSYFDVAAG